MTRIASRIGPRGQMVVPKAVREELGLRPGDVVYVSTHQGHAHVEKEAPPTTWEDVWRDVPKKRLPADHDWDAEYEGSYEE